MSLIILLTILFEVSFSSSEDEGNGFQIGFDTFEEVAMSPFFVDKSLLIKEFFRHGRTLITAPPCFGKSINMDMIKNFCEVTVDADGNRAPKTLTKSYKLFSENNLEIFRDTRFFEDNFGVYPTIFLDFKLLGCASYDECLSSFRDMLVELFARHEYLLNSRVLQNREKLRFKQFHRERIASVREIVLQKSVNTLSELLFTHFNKTKCIVLIDDYDAPIQQAIRAGSFVDKTIYFIQTFVSNALNSNPFIERALLNARVRLSRMITGGANEIEHYQATEKNPFNRFYGLTETELVGLAKKFQVDGELDCIRKWYDGYMVAGIRSMLHMQESTTNNISCTTNNTSFTTNNTSSTTTNTSFTTTNSSYS